MNRKEFFKKLGLGALVAVVAPKVLTKEDESHLFTQSRGNGHILSYKDAQLIADESLKARMWYPQSQISHADFMRSAEIYQRYYDEAWRKLEVAFMKSQKEKITKDLILYGRAETKLF